MKYMKILDLRIDALVDPMGIDTTAPIFSWKCDSDVIGAAQSAYRIVVRSKDITVWDSGKVDSSLSAAIPYCGDTLKSLTHYDVSLTIWDEKGVESDPAVATFDTGFYDKALLERASYITSCDTVGTALPVFRKVFTPKKPFDRVMIYTSGLGVYESWINGSRIGKVMPDGAVAYHELKPGFTEAAKRKFYSAYNVTSLIKSDKQNVICAEVCNSWWSDKCAANYGKENAFWAQLVIEYTDGEVDTIVTDTTWKSAKVSPIQFADIYNGEVYDARIDRNWFCPCFDDSSWANVKVNTEFNGVLCAWRGSPITVRKDRECAPVSVLTYSGATGATDDAYGKINVLARYDTAEVELLPGQVLLIDFGQNFAGWEAIKLEGKAGTTVTIEHGEMLNDQNGVKARGNDGPEGSIYNLNYRSAKAMTKYTMSGNGIESYHPSMTFYGFRYIEIIADAPIKLHDAVGQVVTSVERDTGFIKTSDCSVNKLISNIRWGQFSNYLSIPTDCPQRDERQGWTADTQVFSEAGCYMAYSKSFLHKFTMDIRDSQREDGAIPGTSPTGNYNGGGWGGTGWADAGVIIPYNLYMLYGDKSVITDNMDAMKLYVDGFLAKTNKYGPIQIWGDWLAYESNGPEVQEILGVAFYAWDALMMAYMCREIGNEEDAKHYDEIYQQEKAFFIEKYVGEDGKLNRGEQSVCLYALYLDLLPNEKSYAAVKEQLVSNIERNGNKLQTGFLGTAIIMPTLTKIGRADLAYSLLLQHDNPSWLYSVDQGATTIWERWNSYTKVSGFGDVGMNSFNHYAYGAVASWMFKHMAGIGYDHKLPGFKRIIMAPCSDTRLSFDATYISTYGHIHASSKYTDKTWTYTCEIPANTTASITVKGAVSVNGKALCELSSENDGIAYVGDGVFEAVHGKFVFEANL